MRALLGSTFILIFAFGCGKKGGNTPELPDPVSGASGNPNGAPIPSAPTGNRYVNDFGMEFARVPKGTLWSSWGKQEIPDDFYIGVYEVTQQEWEAVTGKNPSYFSAGGKGAAGVQGIPPDDLKRFPVESIVWQDARDFCALLNTKHKLDGWQYRLPTQREWEYAARGAEQDKEKAQYSFHFRSGPTNTITTRQANFGKLDWLRRPNLPGALGRPCRVGSYEPNELGLFDMHGNIWEWCEDIHTPPSTDRVQCGGAYISAEADCSAGNRGRGDHTLRGSADDGLRVVLAPTRTVPTPPVVTGNPAPVGKSDPQVSKLTATGLVGMLKSDPKSENRYKNKLFQIEGTVAEVDDEHGIVTLRGTKIANVRCFFGPARTDLAHCTVGQKVTVQGTLSASSADGHAQLLKCEVVK